MEPSMRTFLRVLLRGISWIFMAIGGLAFWVGGRMISEIAKVDRLLGEMLGLAFAGGCLVVGMVSKSLAEPDEPEEEMNSTSGGSLARK